MSSADTHGAPASLAVEAKRKQLSVDQAEKLAHCQTAENNMRHLLRFVQEHGADGDAVDAGWLTIGRTHLQIGMMCIRRAITRQDFF
jgi:hypothetical protein